MKRYLFALIIMLGCFPCMSQVAYDIHTIYQKLKPEFIYVHTDRTIYLSGETIWFKTYLSNVPFQKENLSVIVYVELIKDNELLLRKKIKSVDGLAYGSIEIPEDIPTGDYSIRAYTRWMKNTGNPYYYEQSLVFFNFKKDELKFDYLSNESKYVPGGDTSIFKIFKKDDELLVKLKNKMAISVAAQHKGEMLWQKGLSNVDEELTIKDLPFGLTEFGVFDDRYELVGGFSFRSIKNPKYKLIAEINKQVFSTREKVELTLKIIDENRKPIKGNLSVSIVPKDFSLNQIERDYFDGTLSFKTIHRLRSSQAVHSKEQLVFPKPSQPIEPVEFKMPQNSANKNSVSISMSDTAAVHNLFNRYKLKSEIFKSYGKSGTGDEYRQNKYNLPFDNVYYPSDYSQMPTLEDFIREVIGNVKIKNTGANRTLRVLNTENKAKVFLYKSDPLILVNGVVRLSVDEILDIDLSIIDEIGLIWKTNSLAKTSIAKLADAGMLVLRTKDGVEASMKNGEESISIYDGFSSSEPFFLVDYSSSSMIGDRIPDFRNPLHWAPDVGIEGKQNLIFYTSDEAAQFVIDVSGITEDGSVVYERLEFLVR